MDEFPEAGRNAEDQVNLADTVLVDRSSAEEGIDLP